MRERTVETYLVQEVKKLGGEIRKIRWIGRHGCPDRLVWLPGWEYPILVELKAPKKPLKEHQKREHKRLRQMGFYCCKIDDRESVDEIIGLP